MEQSAIVRQERLERWGRRVGADPGAPLFLALRGDLGSGKSVLARAIGRGAGVTGHMPSPTFNLMYRYPTGTVGPASGVSTRTRADGDSGGAGSVVHLDLYRVTSVAEVIDLGFAELGRPDEIVLVEWAERAESLLPRDRWDVMLSEVEGQPLLRRVTVRVLGAAPPAPPFEA